MKEWQFNVLFFVGVGGAVIFLIGPDIGIDISQNPGSAAGVGAILTYVLSQRQRLTSHDKKKPPKDKDEEVDNGVR